jgi:hypothetical protein
MIWIAPQRDLMGGAVSVLASQREIDDHRFYFNNCIGTAEPKLEEPIGDGLCKALHHRRGMKIGSKQV